MNAIDEQLTSNEGPETRDSESEAAESQAAAPAAAPRLNGDILATSLLAFLRVSSAYGYHLVQQLSEANLPAFDSGTVYRTLRQLEKGGLVSSFWDTSECGPARRMYQLTAPGNLFLGTWIEALERHQAVLRRAIEAVQRDQVAEASAADQAPPNS
jgi:poly-beta-hydroxybutyrate-responsive repressor